MTVDQRHAHRARVTETHKRHWKIRDERLQALGMTYQQYLASPHWLATRQRYKKSRLRQTCYVCSNTKVELHHKTYKRLGAEYLMDLLPLCRDCHEKTHRMLRESTSTWTNLWNVARKLRSKDITYRAEQRKRKRHRKKSRS